MSPFDALWVAAKGMPVLCIDTCSLLDIVRDPTRDEIRPHERQAAIDLLARIKSGDLVCLIASQVEREFQDNDQAVQDEAATAIRKLRERVVRMNEILDIFLPSVSVSLRHLDDLVAPARSVVQGWLDSSLLVPSSTGALVRVMERVNRNLSPARKGKDSVKDCLVFETYLEALDDLRAAGLAATSVFLSSNSKEYLSEGRVLKSDLASDFADRRLLYASNMAQAQVNLGF